MHQVGDAIQPPHPISSLSPPALSFPASESFPVSQFFASGGQSIGVSASASVLPVNVQHWFPLGLTVLISLQSKGFSRVFSNITVQRISSTVLSFLYGRTLTFIHPYMTTGKTIALTRWTFLRKVMSLIFIMLSRLVITFLPRNKCQFHGCSHHLQWFWSPRK